MWHGRHYSTLCKAPELVFQEGSALSRLVLARCPALLQPYCPTFWATNAHAQTVLCGALASAAQQHGLVLRRLLVPDMLTYVALFCLLRGLLSK